MAIIEVLILCSFLTMTGSLVIDSPRSPRWVHSKDTSSNLSYTLCILLMCRLECLEENTQSRIFFIIFSFLYNSFRFFISIKIISSALGKWSRWYFTFIDHYTSSKFIPPNHIHTIQLAGLLIKPQANCFYQILGF